MKKIIFYSCLVLSTNLMAKISSVYDTQKKLAISYNDFISQAASSQFVVLGEFHNDLEIQKAEGQIIRDTAAGQNKTVSVMWEFLNFTEQEKISSLYSKFLTNEMTSKEFVKNTVGEINLTYTEVIEASKDVNANLIGLNLPREIKQKVIKNGIASIDQSLVPESHYLGGLNYYSRFVDSMGGHVPKESLDAYFTVQCLTDSVMAYQAVLNQRVLNFIVAGSFHTNFFDGTVEKLKKLNEGKVTSLSIVNADKMTDEDIELYKTGDSLNGQFADFIIFTSEK